jgi:hypothetical protein|tara:strand:- start:43 stop:264 length:222 start_codon:yes stop_codon:yes gene_type:complete
MGRNDGIRYGAGGQPMTIQEVVGEVEEVKSKSVSRRLDSIPKSNKKATPKKKVQVLEERILDEVPLDEDGENE